MLSFPNAKINIGLNIVEKRSDGFHNIESVFYPVGLSDVLEVVNRENSEERIANRDKDVKYEVQSTKFEVAGENIEFSASGIEIPGRAEENLCCKAYELISKDYPLPSIKIHLHKIIPIGAGLGGGSADAAFFIKLINEKFELGLAWGEMHHYAKQLGSDCSFFISNKPAFVKGKGDDFEGISLDLAGYKIAIIYPGIHINTAEAYKGVIPKKPKQSLEKLIQQPIESWKDSIHNDFEDSIFQKYPKIKKIKEQLYESGALYASMSGSGSSVYGIFKKEDSIKSDFIKQGLVWVG
jgi:4-diphosphocytidyl-2-C-methyl-D-erythritol kinase